MLLDLGNFLFEVPFARQASMARGDLSDQAWQRIEAYIPQNEGRRGGRYREHRPILNGILWIMRTGAPWRDLPERYGPWQTCYDRLARWKRKGTWERLLQSLQKEAGALGQHVAWEGCAADSTSIKVHPHAAGARKAPAKKGAVALVRRRVIRKPKVWDEAEAV